MIEEKIKTKEGKEKLKQLEERKAQLDAEKKAREEQEERLRKQKEELLKQKQANEDADREKKLEINRENMSHSETEIRRIVGEMNELAPKIESLRSQLATTQILPPAPEEVEQINSRISMLRQKQAELKQNGKALNQKIAENPNDAKLLQLKEGLKQRFVRAGAEIKALEKRLGNGDDSQRKANAEKLHQLEKQHAELEAKYNEELFNYKKAKQLIEQLGASKAQAERIRQEEAELESLKLEAKKQQEAERERLQQKRLAAEKEAKRRQLEQLRRQREQLRSEQRAQIEAAQLNDMLVRKALSEEQTQLSQQRLKDFSALEAQRKQAVAEQIELERQRALAEKQRAEAEALAREAEEKRKRDEEAFRAEQKRLQLIEEQRRREIEEEVRRKLELEEQEKERQRIKAEQDALLLAAATNPLTNPLLLNSFNPLGLSTGTLLPGLAAGAAVGIQPLQPAIPQNDELPHSPESSIKSSTQTRSQPQYQTQPQAQPQPTGKSLSQIQLPATGLPQSNISDAIKTGLSQTPPSATDQHTTKEAEPKRISMPQSYSVAATLSEVRNSGSLGNVGSPPVPQRPDFLENKNTPPQSTPPQRPDEYASSAALPSAPPAVPQRPPNFERSSPEHISSQTSDTAIPEDKPTDLYLAPLPPVPPQQQYNSLAPTNIRDMPFEAPGTSLPLDSMNNNTLDSYTPHAAAPPPIPQRPAGMASLDDLSTPSTIPTPMPPPVPQRAMNMDSLDTFSPPSAPPPVPQRPADMEPFDTFSPSSAPPPVPQRPMEMESNESFSAAPPVPQQLDSAISPSMPIGAMNNNDSFGVQSQESYDNSMQQSFSDSAMEGIDQSQQNGVPPPPPPPPPPPTGLSSLPEPKKGSS